MRKENFILLEEFTLVFLSMKIKNVVKLCKDTVNET